MKRDVDNAGHELLAAVESVLCVVEARLTAAVERALQAHVTVPFAKAADRLTLAEAATELRCSQRQVRRLVAAGRLRVIKLREGGSARVLVARGELERLVRESTR